MTYLGRAFGTLYYAIPNLPTHQHKVTGEEIGFSEYALGVLWMIDLMQHELGSCFQKKLGEYLKEWWPSVHDVNPRANSHPARTERLNKDSALSRTISDFVRAD